MSQALYRKYRSQRFTELVGQQGVTRVLRNAIVRERLGHAYLFCGPRGTGKTSVARIFAKAINCMNPQEGDCCGECEVCQAVAEGRAVDVIEIDAASYRQVDEIKEILIDRVGYAPQTCQRKVYIIDEVHMLSPHSFNAFLKTLEEPPGHVVFCLCTTEPHKLPLTILSRCVRFDFHRIAVSDLSAHLRMIAAEEGFNLADDASRELALLAEGSARDSISLLDQLLVYCQAEITLDAVRELFQLSDPKLLSEAVDLLAQLDAAPLLSIWENLACQGADAGQFLIRLSAAVKERYLDTAEEGWRRALGKLWEGLNLLKFESFPALLVELTLLSAQQAFQASQPVPSNIESSSAQVTGPRAVKTEPPATARENQQTVPRTGTAPAATAPPRRERTHSQETTATAQPSQTNPREHWKRFCQGLQAKQMTTYALVQDSVNPRLEGSVLRLIFDADARAAYRFIQQDKHFGPLACAVREAYAAPLQIAVEIGGEPDSRVILTTTDSASGVRRPAQPEPPKEIIAEVFSEDYAYELSDNAGGSTPPQGPPKTTRERQTADAPENLSVELGSQTSVKPDKSNITKQDLLDLFEAVEIQNDPPTT